MADSFQLGSSLGFLKQIHSKIKEDNNSTKMGVSKISPNVKPSAYSTIFTKKIHTAGLVLFEAPMNSNRNYFELKVLEQGLDCKIGIGLGPSPYPGSLKKMPGWDPQCIGYHGDDGGLFHGNGFGQPFGPSCKKGDTMGCGVDFVTCDPEDVEAFENDGFVKVWFTRNGQMVGHVVDAKVPRGGFFPLIGLGTCRALLSAQYLGHSHVDPPYRSVQKGPDAEKLVDRAETGKKYYQVKRQSALLSVKRTRDSWVTLWKDAGNCGQAQLEGPGPVTKTYNYFEIKIVGNSGEFGVGIGLGPINYPGSFQHMPGWDANCIGYHSDDGKLFHEYGRGKPFGPTCSEGDIMGCGVDFAGAEDEGMANVWFTKNQVMVGPPINVKILKGGFFPLIGLGTSGDVLTVKYLGHVHQEPPFADLMQPYPPAPLPPPCSRGGKVTVVYPYDAQRDDELTSRPGDKITVEDWDVSDHWAKGKLIVRSGYFLKAFTRPVNSPSAKQLHSPQQLRSIPKGHETSFAGSVYFLTEPAQDWLECIICQQIACTPRQTSCCGHTICYTCADQWRGKSDTCPQCRVSPFQILEDPRAERLVNGLTAYCQNYELGCNWKGSLTRVQQHINEECMEELVECPNKCDAGQIHRQNLQEHISYYCKLRKVNCPCCSKFITWDHEEIIVRGHGMTYNDIISTHYKICPDWPVRCPNSCNPHPPVHFTRSSLETHLSDECPEVDVDCLCAGLGCSVRVKRKDRQTHIENDFLSHFLCLLHGYDELKTENALLKQRISALEQ